MGITDELREYTKRLDDLFNNLGMVCRTLLAIADRIDKEHESEISRAAQLLADAEKDRDFNYASWQDCKHKVLQHNITIDELDAEIERLKDALARCIALPVDADGKVIHIGDVMEFIYDPPQDQPLFEVSGFGADGTLFYAPKGEVLPRKTTKASVVRHHKQPTVEDVLDEIVDKANSIGCAYAKNDISGEEMMGALQEIVAEYAAKLRLAGDAK